MVVFPAMEYIPVVSNSTDRCIFARSFDPLDSEGFPEYSEFWQSFSLVFNIVLIIFNCLCVAVVIYDNYTTRVRGDLPFIVLMFFGVVLSGTRMISHLGFTPANSPNDFQLCSGASALILVGFGTLGIVLFSLNRIHLFLGLSHVAFGDILDAPSGYHTSSRQGSFEHSFNSGSDTSERTPSSTVAITTVPSDPRAMHQYKTDLYEYRAELEQGVKTYDQRKRYVYILLLAGVLTVAFLIGVGIAVEPQPLYLRHCFGVFDTVFDGITHLLLELICVVVFLITFYLNRKYPNPLELAHVVPYLIFGGTLAFVGTGFLSFATNQTMLYAGGNLLSIALTVGFFGVSARPLMKKRRSKKRAINEPQSLDKFLHDQVARRFFAMFCVTHLSIENLMFYTDVRRWKMMGLDSELSLEAAEFIYDIYLTLDSPFEINIVHGIGNKVKKHLEIVNEMKEPLDLSVFDAALADVVVLMKTDVFPLFVRSRFHRKYQEDFLPL